MSDQRPPALGLPGMAQYSVPLPAPGKPISAPVLLASFAGPFRVVNQSNVATVWLADNPSVKPGSGMVLAPGTSLVWTGSQSTAELWGILGTDSATVTAGIGLVLIGATADDVQPNPIAIALAILNNGLIVIDNPVQLDAIPGGGGGFTSGPFDVTRYQSIDVQYQPNGAAASLVVSWSQNGTVIGQDAFSWTAGDINVLRKKLACRGDKVTVTGTNTGASPYTLFGSGRPVSPYNASSLTERIIATGANAALAAGATLNVNPTSRYDGPGYITGFAFAASAAALPVALQLIDTDSLTPFGVVYGVRFAGVLDGGISRAWISTPVIFPRSTWQVQLINFSAAAQNAGATAYAGPEGT